MSKKDTSEKKPIIFKKNRGGIELTKDEIKYIKRERKKLRKEMRSQGLRKRKDFEVTASSLGLYFDKKRKGILFWFFSNGKPLWMLLGSLFALLVVMYLFSLVPQLKGHFTINMSRDMLKNGFVLCETKDFANPAVQLFSDPVSEAPCISFANLPEDINSHEGNSGDGSYFAYTFFLRNEGQDTVDYSWQLDINSESKNLSSAAWVMVFEDEEMKFYAKKGEDGQQESIPAKNVTNKGYPTPVLRKYAANKKQFEIVGNNNGKTYYRINPINFVSNDIVAQNMRYDIAPSDVHKYTVIIWLEGDDPDCVDDLIGGHIGLEMNFQLFDDTNREEQSLWEEILDIFDWN